MPFIFMGKSQMQKAEWFFSVNCGFCAQPFADRLLLFHDVSFFPLILAPCFFSLPWISCNSLVQSVSHILPYFCPICSHMYLKLLNNIHTSPIYNNPDWKKKFFIHSVQSALKPFLFFLWNASQISSASLRCCRQHHRLQRLPPLR